MKRFDLKKLPSRIREGRKCIGMTQLQLAEKSSLQAMAISHYECGRREPNLAHLCAIASSLKVSADFLCGGPDYFLEK